MAEKTPKTFILGLGAQKAGTSWLASYLRASGRADFGLAKEYHVWDVRDDPDGFRRFRVDEAVLFRNRTGPRLPVLRLRYAMQQIDGVYGWYFRSLLQHSGKSITGDITPSYAGLSEATLRHLRGLLEEMGFAVRAVFLMRDPVERIWSAVRMERRLLLNNTATTLADLPAVATQVAESYAGRDAELRTRYDRTLQRIEAVFDPGQIYTGFYETLFDDAPLAALSDFLGVPVNASHRDVQVNVTDRGAELPADLKQAIRAHYAPVYAYCHDRFPETRELWD